MNQVYIYFCAGIKYNYILEMVAFNIKKRRNPLIAATSGGTLIKSEPTITSTAHATSLSDLTTSRTEKGKGKFNSSGKKYRK